MTDDQVQTLISAVTDVADAIRELTQHLICEKHLGYPETITEILQAIAEHMAMGLSVETRIVKDKWEEPVKLLRDEIPVAPD